MKKIKTVVTRHTGYLYGIDEEFKKEKFKKSKSEKGSISVFVIVAFIFCMTILITLYWKSSNYQISVLQSEQIIKDIYGEDVSKIDEVHGQFETGKLEEEFKDNTKVQYVINYPVDIDGDEDYTDDWEIFYIEDYKGEDGAFPGNQPTKGKRIFLIASDYAKILDDPESAIRKSMGKSYLLQSSQEKQKQSATEEIQKINNIQFILIKINIIAYCLIKKKKQIFFQNYLKRVYIRYGNIRILQLQDARQLYCVLIIGQILRTIRMQTMQ